MWNATPGVIGHLQTHGVGGVCGGDKWSMDMVCRVEGGELFLDF